MRWADDGCNEPGATRLPSGMACTRCPRTMARGDNSDFESVVQVFDQGRSG